MKRPIRTLLPIALAACSLMTPSTAQGPVPRGGQIINLPSLELDESIQRLTPIGREVEQAARRIEPFIERYERNPTEENRRTLETEIAGLMGRLSSGLLEASSEREKVQFALEDLGRYSSRSERRLGRLTERMTGIVADSAVQRDAALKNAQEAARAWRAAPPEEKREARRRLDAAARELRHLTQLAEMHGRFATDIESMTDGIGILLQQFDQLGAEIDGLFDELELGSDLLRNVAEQREITSELLNIYESFIGEGRELKTAIDELNTLRGKLGLVRGVVTRLSDVGEFTAQVSQIRELNARVSSGAQGVDAIEDLVLKLESGQNPFAPSTVEEPMPPVEFNEEPPIERVVEPPPLPVDQPIVEDPVVIDPPSDLPSDRPIDVDPEPAIERVPPAPLPRPTPPSSGENAESSGGTERRFVPPVIEVTPTPGTPQPSDGRPVRSHTTPPLERIVR